MRDYLEVPILVENLSSYAEFHASEMTEWEFLNEVVERADCGILLDVNNIYVSSKNHSFDPYEYLNNIPHHRVGQMHIAGHSKFEKYLLDTHDHPVLDPVWKMYAHVSKLTGATATLLEWDDRIPSFDEVHKEALKANKFCKELVMKKPRRKKSAPRRKSVVAVDRRATGSEANAIPKEGANLNAPRARRSRATTDGYHEMRDIQRLFAKAVMRPLTKGYRMQPKWTDGRSTQKVVGKFIKPNDRLSSFERIEIYNKQYWFRLLDSLYEDFPGLRALLGDTKFHQLSIAYIDKHPSTSFTLRDLGQHMEKFLARNPKWAKPHGKFARDLVRLELGPHPRLRRRRVAAARDRRTPRRRRSRHAQAESPALPHAPRLRLSRRRFPHLRPPPRGTAR